jgi:hypothetical protein
MDAISADNNGAENETMIRCNRIKHSRARTIRTFELGTLEVPEGLCPVRVVREIYVIFIDYTIVKKISFCA